MCMIKFWILAGPCRAHSIILTYTTVKATKEKYSLEAEVDPELGFPTLSPGKPYTHQALASCCSIRDDSLRYVVALAISKVGVAATN